jgi:hypothetical protein
LVAKGLEGVSAAAQGVNGELVNPPTPIRLDADKLCIVGTLFSGQASLDHFKRWHNAHRGADFERFLFAPLVCPTLAHPRSFGRRTSVHRVGAYDAFPRSKWIVLSLS